MQKESMKRDPGSEQNGDEISVNLVASEKLKKQIQAMVAAQEDWIPDADGVDHTRHVVMNEFTEGVWLCAHNGEVNAKHFTRLQRLA